LGAGSPSDEEQAATAWWHSARTVPAATTGAERGKRVAKEVGFGTGAASVDGGAAVGAVTDGMGPFMSIELALQRPSRIAFLPLVERLCAFSSTLRWSTVRTVIDGGGKRVERGNKCGVPAIDDNRCCWGKRWVVAVSDL